VVVFAYIYGDIPQVQSDLKGIRNILFINLVPSEIVWLQKYFCPEDMESEVEHREVPTEEAAVKSSGTMKKRHRGRHIAAGRRSEPKELTRGDCGSRRKLAAACRKASSRARVAWFKRNVFRKIRTPGNCGPQKELVAVGKGMTNYKTGRAQGIRWQET
jgi:hypothetical protein